MATKKVFAPLMAMLATAMEENPNVKVKSVMSQIEELTSAKAGGGGRSSDNVVRDADGNVTHIFCYYHKKWEAVAEVEFGKKASSPTGLSNMCKEGTGAWTKQQRDSKKAREELLSQVAAGEVIPGDIEARTNEIDEARKVIVAREDGKGSDDKPEA